MEALQARGWSSGGSAAGGVARVLLLLVPVLGCAPPEPELADPAEQPAVVAETLRGPRALVAEALPAFLAARGQTSWPAPSGRMARVRAALAAADGAAAEELVSAELAQYPDSLEAILIKSQLEYSRAKMVAARPGLERVLAGGPSFEGAWSVFYYYGGCLLRLGDGAGARAALEAHLELAPDDGETLYLLGELELQEGAADAALERFREALTAHARSPAPTRALVEVGVARALLTQGQVEAAQEALERSLALDSLAPQSHYLRARILTRLGDKAGARHATVDFKRCEKGLEPRYYGHDDQAGGEEQEE